MRILYVCADTGICVDRPVGAGSHVRETVETLRSSGHDITVLAADCALSSVSGVANGLPGKRIIRHRWFPFLMDWRSWGRLIPEIKSVNATPVEVRGLCTIDSKRTEFGNGIDNSWDKVESGDEIAIPVTPPPYGLSKLRDRMSDFFYGSFRERLNQIEEKTAYPKRFVRIFQQTIDEFLPDAVYERYALGHHDATTICNQRGIPHILEVNALLAREAAEQGLLPSKKSKQISKQELDFLRNQTQKVLVVSDQLKNEIGRDLDHIDTNPNGVDVDFFSPNIPPGPVLKKYGLENVPLLGWVGSFGRGRGVEEFLEIAAQIHQRQPNVHFLLIGDGPLRDQVSKTVQERNLKEVVVLTGSIPKSEIPAHIAAMDIALAPYPAYGAEYFSPLKVFEYMAMAKPVAATAIGQCIDLLQDDMGLLLPPEHPDIWAEEIINLLNDRGRREEMGNRARDRVMKHYTWKRNAERIIEYFESLRAESRHGRA